MPRGALIHQFWHVCSCAIVFEINFSNAIFLAGSQSPAPWVPSSRHISVLAAFDLPLSSNGEHLLIGWVACEDCKDAPLGTG